VFVELHRKTRETALANQALFDEVLERRRVQDELIELNLDLERRVQERTSELLAANEALRESDRRKDEFLAMLGHELRNPLAPILNSIHILKLPAIKPELLQRTQEIIERQVRQMVRLVDDLLDVSRVMRGKVELRRELVEVAAVIARAVETVQPLIDAQGHRLEVSLPASSMILNADPLRLAQVVGNLLTNAAKYTEAKGTIKLNVYGEEDRCVIEVIDNGIGIRPEMLHSVFELFVQVDHSTTRSQGGLGIGLTLVKSLVEMHGGCVAAESDGLGKGSRFVVRLPREVDHSADDMYGGSEDDVSLSASSAFQVLVVDDNIDAATSLAALLQLHGHCVRVAHDGWSALELFDSLQPDVVFLDLGMPGIDGCEVANRMRQKSETSDVVLVALTGWGQEEDRRRTATAGFNLHLVKPPELQAVSRIFTTLADRRGSQCPRRYDLCISHTIARRVNSAPLARLSFPLIRSR